MDTPVDYNHRDKTLRHVTASPLAPHGRRQRLRFALYFVGCTHAHCPARRAAPLKHSKAPTPRSSGHSLAHLSGQLCASRGAPAVSTSPHLHLAPYMSKSQPSWQNLITEQRKHFATLPRLAIRLVVEIVDKERRVILDKTLPNMQDSRTSVGI